MRGLDMTEGQVAVRVASHLGELLSARISPLSGSCLGPMAALQVLPVSRLSLKAPEVTAQAGEGADPQPKTSLWLEAGGSHAGLRVLYASVIN